MSARRVDRSLHIYYTDTNEAHLNRRSNTQHLRFFPEVPYVCKSPLPRKASRPTLYEPQSLCAHFFAGQQPARHGPDWNRLLHCARHVHVPCGRLLLYPLAARLPKAPPYHGAPLAAPVLARVSHSVSAEHALFAHLLSAASDSRRGNEGKSVPEAAPRSPLFCLHLFFGLVRVCARHGAPLSRRARCP